jgi:HPt (histidine-containing phosphotransfer) domain-containing protein
VTDIHLDPTVLVALAEIMESEYPVLLDTFLRDSQLRLSQLQQTHDPVRLGQAAHSFKGSSSNMGAARLAQLCGLLEEQVKKQPLSGVEELVIAIDHEFATVRGLYQAERARFLH